MIKDSAYMPRNLGFRSDVRRKISYRDLMVIYGTSPGADSTKTAPLALAVFAKVATGGSLVFPGHVLNAADYILLIGEKYVGLPSRVPKWLYDHELIDAQGNLTKAGQIKAQELR